MNPASTSAAQPSNITLPSSNPYSPITIAADSARHWQQGSYDVWLLRGNCYINQDLTYARASEAVLWIEHGDPHANQPSRITAYLEGDKVLIDYAPTAGGSPAAGQPTARVSDRTWFGSFTTLGSLKMNVPSPDGEPAALPPIYQRGMARLQPESSGAIRRAQYTEVLPGPIPTDTLPPGTRRVRIFRRSDVRVQAQWFQSPTRDESIGVITSGVNVIIDGLGDVETSAGAITVGSVDISADRVVIWTQSAGQIDLDGQSLQADQMPLELYMEGNIVFRQGERVIYAQRMYYDVRRQIGTVLDAELLSPIPRYEGQVRLEAGVLRQLDGNRFLAQQALLTTSRLGEPSYYFTSDQIAFEDIQRPLVDPVTGAPLIDPETGQPLTDHEYLATSTNNFLYAGGVPVLWWPTMATDLSKPTFYIDQLRIGNDSVFGTQVLVDWNAYQVFGIDDPPEGTDWTFSTDYLSDRGPAGGTNFEYDRAGFLGFAGRTFGFVDAWGIHDDGRDNLGLDRRSVELEQSTRGRVLWNHRQVLPNNYTLTAELGFISDFNFLEQYYENEWDERKDQTTGVELKQIFDNQSWSVTADVRLNDFFTQTEHLPRLDHFWLGQPLWGDRLTWFEHSQISYSRLRAGRAPESPSDLATWNPLPWDADVEGEKIVTRQEIDLPFEAGPVKIVPFALGELAHWGEDFAGNDLQRAYFQTGARASLPMWTVDPSVEDPLLNLHGLAHKVVFETEFAYSDASQDLDDLPLYEQLDDDSIEHFRRRLYVNTFGGMPGPFGDVPLRFDERYYALRSGMQGWVTSPSTEIADDLMTVRGSMRNRWQTKRGPEGNRRIIDWIVLDVGATWFPEEDRDNFGEPLGLLDYDLRWHVGDRLTVVSDGFFDFFDQGLQTASVGGFLTRPPRGSAYVGFRSIEGPITSNVISASYAYWMSPKWVSTFGAAVDLNETGNIGQSFSVTRIGEAMLVTLGMNVDESKDNLGVHFLIEPRFLSSSRLTQALGLHIPPAGAYGLE
ncbi:MAG: organic solvent tolerance protein OstA [Pirellulales bacterium]